MSPKITELCSYPVKSCAGVSLDACALTSTGLAFDRLFCVVNAADGKFISQRSHPRLSLVACAIEPPDAFTDRTARQFALTCETSSMATKLRVEVDLDDASGTATSATNVECWEWRGKAAKCGDEAGRWFSEFLNQTPDGDGAAYELVRWMGKGGAPSAPQDADDLDVDDDVTRLTSENYGSRRATTTLSDGYPMLLVNAASVRAMHELVREETEKSNAAPVVVDNRRFRGNVVVDDAKAYAEDTWSVIALGAREVQAELCKPCSRCSIPLVDPDVGSPALGAPLARALRRRVTNRQSSLAPVPVFRLEFTRPFDAGRHRRVARRRRRARVGDPSRVPLARRRPAFHLSYDTYYSV